MKGHRIGSAWLGMWAIILVIAALAALLVLTAICDDVEMKLPAISMGSKEAK